MSSSSSFFLPGAAPDETYRFIRDEEMPKALEARAYVESLWRRVAPYVDADTPVCAMREFSQRFWEMYVAAALLTRGVSLVPREGHPRRKEGPDLLLGSSAVPPPLGAGETPPRVWIECVLASPGAGPDAVPPIKAAGPGEPPQAYYVPDDQIKLRLRNALDEKSRKWARYRETRVVGPADMYVIAVGSAGIPHASLESTLPRIVRSVLPFGHEQAHWDVDSGQVTGRSFDYRDHVAKRNGSPVSTAFFLENASSGVSAVLYAWADALNHPDVPGAEFVTVHNPSAANPLPRSAFPFGEEYWVDGDQLVRHHHGVRPEATPAGSED